MTWKQQDPIKWTCFKVEYQQKYVYGINIKQCTPLLFKGTISLIECCGT
jgi:hypothetical protein